MLIEINTESNIIKIDGKPVNQVTEPQPECRISSDGSKYWYLNDHLHRVDGPAIEGSDGSKSWWLNGKRHRVDGPAIEYPNGSKEWYLNGKRHRVDGPAIEYPNGTKE